VGYKRRYERAAAVAKKAVTEDLPLKEAALQAGAASSEEFDEWVDPKKMLAPHPLTAPAPGPEA